MNILEWVALKRGKVVRQIGRWERTTAKCSGCDHHQAMELRERVFKCGACGLVLDRDHNAAINILCVGASTPYRNERKTRVRLRARVEGSSPQL